MRFKTVIFYLLLAKIGTAQDYGIQWVIGYKESVLDFRNAALTNYPIGPIMPMLLTSANICDSSGNLLYYTNGIYIAGKDGNQIKNGDSLNPCSYTYDNICCGLDIPQAALFLPRPDDTSKYYLFHFSNDSADNLRPGTLYYSLIDKEMNGDTGAVIEKNIPVFHGILREGGMTACKHGNGRDWWIILPGANNMYYKVLLTPDTILGPDTQAIGPYYSIDLDVAYSKFSQDGSKYATSCYQGLVLVMDFDRCSGEFSNPVTIFNEACDSPYSCSGAGSVEFAPNNRFLYVTNSLILNQYDLSQPDPQHDSILLYQAASNDEAQMGYLQIAPNNKIYASCFNGGFYFIHAVNLPDLEGDSAEYVDTAFTTLTTASINLPNMVNYQLGALQGRPCDTPNAITSQQPTIRLRVMPNPADKYVYVEMGMQGNYEFDLINELGEVIAEKRTRQIDFFDTESLSTGIYFLHVIDKSSATEIPTQKIVVLH